METFAPVAFGAAGVAFDQDFAIWTEPIAGTVQRMAKSGGTATPLATGQNSPFEVAALGGYVYWSSDIDGSILRVGSLGGAPTPVAGGALGSAHYWLDGTDLYTATANGLVIRHPLAGGLPVTLSSSPNDAFDITGDSTHIYWTSPNLGRVHKAQKSGAGNPAIVIADFQTGPFGIASDATHVYWTTVTGNTVMRVPKQ